MIGLIQRVGEASVDVDGERIGEIGAGILALVGIEASDDESSAEALLKRMLAYRVFGDADGRMNLSLSQTGGGLLLVPQFTLVADTGKGLRPGFSNGAPPARAAELFDGMVRMASRMHPVIATGRFGADMKVRLLNDGPVTFWLHAGPGRQ